MKRERKRYYKLVNEIISSIDLPLKQEGADFSGDVNGSKLILKHGAIEGFVSSDCLTIEINYDLDTKIPFKIITRSMRPMPGYIATGDEVFDETILLYTDSSVYVTALLNKKIRDQLLFIESVFDYVLITESFFLISINLSDRVQADLIVTYMKTMLSVHKDIIAKISTKDRLINNLCTEENTGVLQNTIRMLTANVSRANVSIDKTVKDLLTEKLSHESLEIRFESAKYLKAKGEDHFPELLNSIDDYENPIIIDIISFLGDSMHAENIPVMKKILVNSDNRKVVIEIIKVFGKIGDEKLNSILLNNLKNPDYSVRLELVKALGTCGKKDAVEQLYQIAGSTEMPDIKEAARKSIQQIQSRLGGGDKGWLSISKLSETDGALSVNDEAPEGALSMDSEEDPEEESKKDSGTS
ncbi:MAG: HEAT repeat domain-containing protein [bacterium]|nr:HEAT repeat domain-containing protein [bacterium]